MWISQKVATIQAMVRGLIWKVRVIEICNEKLEAALVIQRAFLGYRGRVAGGQRLFDREVRFCAMILFYFSNYMTEYLSILMNYNPFFVPLIVLLFHIIVQLIPSLI